MNRLELLGLFTSVFTQFINISYYWMPDWATAATVLLIWINADVLLVFGFYIVQALWPTWKRWWEKLTCQHKEGGLRLTTVVKMKAVLNRKKKKKMKETQRLMKELEELRGRTTGIPFVPGFGTLMVAYGVFKRRRKPAVVKPEERETTAQQRWKRAFVAVKAQQTLTRPPLTHTPSSSASSSARRKTIHHRRRRRRRRHQQRNTVPLPPPRDSTVDKPQRRKTVFASLTPKPQLQRRKTVVATSTPPPQMRLRRKSMVASQLQHRPLSTRRRRSSLPNISLEQNFIFLTDNPK